MTIGFDFSALDALASGFGPKPKHQMIYTTKETQRMVIEGLLSPEDCDRLIDQTRGKNTLLKGPGVSDTPVDTPDGPHYPRWNWHCQVHAHGLSDPENELGDVFNRLWYAFYGANELFDWNIPLEVGRFGISNYLPGDRMSAHVDDEAREESTPEAPWVYPHRGISMSVSLSEPGTYQGGQLRMYDGKNWSTPLAGKPRGTAIVFGSSVLHEVTRLTEGERWVLLGWSYNNHYMSGMK